jgi:hypothetical protein
MPGVRDEHDQRSDDRDRRERHRSPEQPDARSV